MSKRVLLFFGIVIGSLALFFGTGFLQQSHLDKSPAASSLANQTATCKLSNNFPSEILQWCDIITANAQANNLDPNLIAALIWQESGGNPNAYSKDGAVGLMQVMPNDGIAASFQCTNGPCFASRPGMDQLFHPAFNVEYGTRFLSGLINHHGDLRDALKAYGPAGTGYTYADIVITLYQDYQ